MKRTMLSAKILMMGCTWMNRSCNLTSGSWLLMSGSGESIGDLGLVERTHFLA